MPRRSQEDFSEEVRAHIDAETEALVADGVPRDAARAAARRKFGNVTRVEERFYESRRFAAWDALSRDLRYAIAALRREPGVVAVLVACLGLGIGVSRDTPELGIRMALGASRGAVRRRVVSTGLRLVGSGAIVGIAAAVLVTWPLRWLLAGANPADPITLTSVAAVLLFAGAAASFIPALRASRIDPATALRRD